LYVNDVLWIHHDVENQICWLDKYFAMKSGSSGDPDIYMGMKVRQVELINGVFAWFMSPSMYISDSVDNVEELLENLQHK
jgi:hypothetical protein